MSDSPPDSSTTILLAKLDELYDKYTAAKDPKGECEVIAATIVAAMDDWRRRNYPAEYCNMLQKAHAVFENANAGNANPLVEWNLSYSKRTAPSEYEERLTAMSAFLTLLIEEDAVPQKDAAEMIAKVARGRNFRFALGKGKESARYRGWSAEARYIAIWRNKFLKQSKDLASHYSERPLADYTVILASLREHRAKFGNHYTGSHPGEAFANFFVDAFL